MSDTVPAADVTDAVYSLLQDLIAELGDPELRTHAADLLPGSRLALDGDENVHVQVRVDDDWRTLVRIPAELLALFPTEPDLEP